MIELRAFAGRDELAEAAAAAMARALEAGVAARGAAMAALSGGETPGPAYERLASLDLDWARIGFALVDERMVAPDAAGSNEGMVRRTLAPALAAGADLAPLYAPGLELVDAAAAANARYAGFCFDIAVLGMGEDGHTASWFPGASGLEAALAPDNPCTVAAIEAPGAAGASARLTLTRSALARARALVLLLVGDAKRQALETAFRQGAPVSLLPALGRPLTAYWAPG